MRENPAEFFWRNEKIKKLIAAGIVTLVLTGCSMTSSGRITDKKFYPAHDTQTTACAVWIPSTQTMPMHCAAYHQVTHRHPDEWRFDLKDDTRGKTGWVYVNKETYDGYKIGDWYSNDKS